MNQGRDRSKKVIALSFLFAAMMFSFMIRFALGVVAPTLMKLYNISPGTMGYILSGWNWSYTGSLLFAGPIVDRVGPWMAMGVGSAIWGLSTAVLPFLATAAVSLFLMRMIFGLGQGILLPSTATSVSRLFGAKERARAISVAFSGNVLGLAASGAISAFILAQFGWEAVFYFLGGGSLLLTLAWFYFYPDKRSGRQAAAEPNRGEGRDHQRVPWISLFRYRSTWGIAFGQMGYLYAYFFFVSWLPGYLVLERGMTALRSGLVSSLLFGMGMLGTLAGGWLGDYLIQRGVSPTVSRKSTIGIGLSGATIMVIAAAYITQAWLAVALLTLCVGSLRLATGPANSLPIDLAPRSLVGSLTSIQNFFGNVGGLLAPIVTGKIVDATGSFVGSLVVAGGMALFGAISYVFIMGNLETHRIEPGFSAATVPLRPSGAL
jgi:MFS family permease